MESSASLPFPQFSIFPPKPNSNTRSNFPFRPCRKQRIISHPTTLQCQKMYVPEQSYNEEAYWDLKQFLEKHSLDDGDKFVADLMRESSRHKGLALRILEVRSAYCKNDFEWDNLKRIALKMVDERNTRLMRDYVSETSSRD
ncbi:hypothetical protein RD792_007660 [Penstemon davidsonii]|uniref:Chaperonin-like RbcX protein n=1 Tax=Penstemon davidsonii TaxID=160366 RepID=A0ABR0D714_9LAMI|nr:hypothetical protein RD792_007660 [Penstemon davidsonii]